MSEKNYTISWKEHIGNIIIPAPAKKGIYYSLSVTLDRYDNASIWNCTIFEDANLMKPISTTNFVTIENTGRINYNDTFLDNNIQITAKLLPPEEYLNGIYCDKDVSQCFCYITENGRIISTSKESNHCIKFDKGAGEHHTKRFSSYNSTQIDNEVITTTTSLPVTSDPDNNDQRDDKEVGNDDDDGSKTWIIVISAAVLLIIIVTTIITIFLCRKRKNKPTTEALYTTANEITYVELQLQNGGTANLVRNEIPYAQVIGFVKKKNKMK